MQHFFEATPYQLLCHNFSLPYVSLLALFQKKQHHHTCIRGPYSMATDWATRDQRGAMGVTTSLHSTAALTTASVAPTLQRGERVCKPGVPLPQRRTGAQHNKTNADLDPSGLNDFHSRRGGSTTFDCLSTPPSVRLSARRHRQAGD